MIKVIEMISVGIIGASGYTGGELLRLLENHRKVEVVSATSRQYSGVPVSRCIHTSRTLT